MSTRLIEIRFELSEFDASLLNKVVNGEGGMQSLLRKLQNQISPHRILTLTGDDIEKIKQYRFKYGTTGGWQQRLKGVLDSIDAINMAGNKGTSLDYYPVAGKTTS